MHVSECTSKMLRGKCEHSNLEIEREDFGSVANNLCRFTVYYGRRIIKRFMLTLFILKLALFSSEVTKPFRKMCRRRHGPSRHVRKYVTAAKLNYIYLIAPIS